MRHRLTAQCQSLIADLVFSRWLRVLVLSISAMAVTASAQVQVALNNRVLTVTGTATGDRILAVAWGAGVWVLARDGQNNRTFILAPTAFVDSLSINGNAGDDRITVIGRIRAEILGGPDDDIISGGAGDDDINGEEGWDVIYGQRGGDWVMGREGDDTLLGGEGDDFIGDGLEDDHDWLYGGNGKDWLMAGKGNDRLYGENGNDELQGMEGEDKLCGGADIDTLWGDADDDGLWGEPGADAMDGGPGMNMLYGNPQEGDTFANGMPNPDAPCCQGGDVQGLHLEAVHTGITASFSGNRLVILGTEKRDKLSVVATAQSIRVQGRKSRTLEYALTNRAPVVILMLGAGDDDVTVSGEFEGILLEAGAGHDSVRMSQTECPFALVLGGEGKDLIETGRGAAVIAGEEGDDVIVSRSDEDWIAGGAGRNRVTAKSGSPLIIEQMTSRQVKLLRPGQ